MLSKTLKRLQSLIYTLEQSDHPKQDQHTCLGFVFPTCEAPVKPPNFPLVDRWDLNYPAEIQPFSNSELKASFEVGRDSCSFGYLGPLLLASIIKPHDTLDFKAYCYNFCTDNESNILSPSNEGHDTRVIEQVIQTWIQQCDIPSSNPHLTFRRCIVIGFISVFKSDDETSSHKSGHAITLGLEIKERVLTLKIFDYRMHEYIHDVHAQLFQWMGNAVQQYATHFDSFHTEMVCLKGKLHVDKEFMTCMSAAFRVCIYLSTDEKLVESDEDFNTDSLNLPNHIWRMFEWAKNDTRLKHERLTALISPPMAELIYEINNNHCYLMLAPYRLPKRLNSKREDPIAIVKYINRTAPRLRYSLKDGFQESLN
jgi:hypothetical protein